MNNRTGLILFVFLLGTVIFGFSELAFEKDVFAKTLIPCCNSGMCTYPNIPCSSNSSAFIKEAGPKPGQILCINEYTITCRECVDLNAAGEICWDPVNSCNMNGECYGWCYDPVLGWHWNLNK
jgi:hypothetical protein